MQSIIIFILLTVSSTATYICMYSSSSGSRCGECVDDYCSSYASYACENYMIGEEEIYVDTAADCEAYIDATTGSIKSADMADCDTGMPRFARRIAKTVFADYSAPDGKITITFQDIQDKLNEYIVYEGAAALEAAVCDILTLGAGAALCQSAVFHTAVDFLNHHFLGKYLHKVVVALDDVEDDIAEDVSREFSIKVGDISQTTFHVDAFQCDNAIPFSPNVCSNALMIGSLQFLF
eukprot:244774_1